MDKKMKALTEEFERIWKIYPRKVGKGAALNAYRARRKEEVVTFEQAWDAVHNYRMSRVGEDSKFTMHCSSFFGPERQGWKEWVPDENQMPPHYSRA